MQENNVRMLEIRENTFVLVTRNKSQKCLCKTLTMKT